MIREWDSERYLEPQTDRDISEGLNRLERDAGHVGHVVFSMLVAVLFLLPLVWMLGASVRKVGLPPPNQLEWIPNPIELSNYLRIFELLPLGSYTLNSLKVVLVAVPLTIITASWAGFAMSQIAPRPRTWLIVASLVALMVPVTALWLTRFLIYKWIGVLDSLWALILPSFMGTSPLFVLLFYWTFSRIPAELYESARLDGAGALRIWGRIAMPLSRASIVAVGVLAFVFFWSNFIDPVLYLNRQQNYTLPMGLQSLQQMQPTNFPLLMAGAVVITVPVIIMFMSAQRFFLQETRGAGWLGR
ncbi:MAG: carbohydrate ABC transporter permease [Chloroflexota bacterium]|nr:carbohydrate ABC transporter permease [Chloroflexota bacterium]